MTTAICWFRRDLRLSDNQALTAALVAGHAVVPALILDPHQLACTFSGERSLAFFLDGVRALDGSLRRIGSYLVIRRGDPAVELEKLYAEVGASAIFAQRDVSPFARERDARVSSILPICFVEGLTLHPTGRITKPDGLPYTVFADYYRAWLGLDRTTESDLLPPPVQVPTPSGLITEPLPSEPHLPPTVASAFAPGEAEGQRRLAEFALAEGRIGAYAEGRDRVDESGTSRLSPYLRFGMVSARQAVAAAKSAAAAAPDGQARAGAEAWLRQLAWRDYYMSILYHLPRVLHEAYRLELRDVRWENDESSFQAWKDGRTGYPLVDAGMRQLLTEGWIHNRVRLVVASFLTKDLLIDWQWGERWFMKQLLDGDPSANNGNWQWTAGVGIDPMQYYRVFNPVLQAKKRDPTGGYVRRWVPELARVPQTYLWEPWRMPDETQAECGCVIGKDYPRPIVSHPQARERALLRYRSALGKE